MKDLNLDIAREYIVRHGHELRSIITSVGRLIPEEGERISFAHLDEKHCAAIKAFCGTLEFLVTEVATLPGERDPLAPPFGEPNGGRSNHLPDAARILVQPVKGSNFPASNSKCQSILQAEAKTPRPKDETGPLSWPSKADSGENERLKLTYERKPGDPLLVVMYPNQAGLPKANHDTLVSVGRAA